MKYANLVKQLREDAEWVKANGWETPIMLSGHLKQAADAIEKLAAYVRQIEELRKDGYYLQKTKMMTYGQATMTQPLPDPPEEE